MSDSSLIQPIGPIQPLDVEFDVVAPVEHAFHMFVGRPLLWWPVAHTISGAPAAIVIEPHVGGRIFERGTTGEEFDWGEVLRWDPPHGVGFLWHLFFPRAEATHVEVSFKPTAAGTLVHLRQTGWERLGDQGETRRERTVQGWATVTKPYRDLFSLHERPTNAR